MAVPVMARSASGPAFWGRWAPSVTFTETVCPAVTDEGTVMSIGFITLTTREMPAPRATEPTAQLAKTAAIARTAAGRRGIATLSSGDGEV
jgi:hypothetical protein